MGLFDKLKDTAKSVANTATEKISSRKEENEKKAAEKNAEVEAIQKLSSVGYVTYFLDKPTVSRYYDFCVDVENERFVMRKVSDRKPFKKFDFKQLHSFKYLNTETTSVGTTTINTYHLSFMLGAFTLKVSVQCEAYNKDSELEESLRAKEGCKIFDLVFAVISGIDDKVTKTWVNEICEFYGLVALFDDYGKFSQDALNSAIDKMVCS